MYIHIQFLPADSFYAGKQILKKLFYPCWAIQIASGAVLREDVIPLGRSWRQNLTNLATATFGDFLRDFPTLQKIWLAKP